jgi:hypothetical protein
VLPRVNTTAAITRAALNAMRPEMASSPEGEHGTAQHEEEQGQIRAQVQPRHREVREIASQRAAREQPAALVSDGDVRDEGEAPSARATPRRGG